MLGVEWGFRESLWAGAGFFAWACLAFAFLYAFIDMLRRRDLSGAAKAGWTVVLVLFPLLGAIVYLIARPSVTAEDLEDDRRRRQEESFRSGASRPYEQIARLR
jgi:membrane protein implicated in regulation of membrane protease activity